MTVPKIIFALPCYNEKEILQESIDKLDVLLKELISQGKIGQDSLVLFVDDGSSDGSWDILVDNMKSRSFLKAIKLSKNFGHQVAIFSGMIESKDLCDACITLDADLQDDLDMIPEMIDKFVTGKNEIVYGVKKCRKADPFFKRIVANWYYKLLHFMGVDIIANHADCRLVSKKALQILGKFKERNLFLRGIFPYIGLKTDKVEYAIKERTGGEPKYSIPKLTSLAFNGITAFSYLPLRYLTFIGFFIMAITFCFMAYVLVVKLTRDVVPGWASTVLPIYFLGGMQIMFMGVIGEYVARIYSEVKQRPHYIIDENKFNG